MINSNNNTNRYNNIIEKITESNENEELNYDE